MSHYIILRPQNNVENLSCQACEGHRLITLVESHRSGRPIDPDLNGGVTPKVTCGKLELIVQLGSFNNQSRDS